MKNLKILEDVVGGIDANSNEGSFSVNLFQKNDETEKSISISVNCDNIKLLNKVEDNSETTLLIGNQNKNIII